MRGSHLSGESKSSGLSKAVCEVDLMSWTKEKALQERQDRGQQHMIAGGTRDSTNCVPMKLVYSMYVNVKVIAD